MELRTGIRASVIFLEQVNDIVLNIGQNKRV